MDYENPDWPKLMDDLRIYKRHQIIDKLWSVYKIEATQMHLYRISTGEYEPRYRLGRGLVSLHKRSKRKRKQQ